MNIFLAATKQLYEWFSPSVCPSVTPFHYVPIIVSSWTFSRVITIGRSDAHAKGQRSKVKVTQVKTQFNRFQFELTYGDEMMHKAWCCIGEVPIGDAAQKLPILTQIGHFRTKLQFEFTNGYKMMHKAWSSIKEASYCFSKSSAKFQCHTGQKVAGFDPKWAFSDCNSRLNSLMALKWCTKLDVVQKRCPIDFQGYLSNFKATQYIE